MLYGFQVAVRSMLPLAFLFRCGLFNKGYAPLLQVVQAGVLDVCDLAGDLQGLIECQFTDKGFGSLAFGINFLAEFPDKFFLVAASFPAELFPDRYLLVA